MGKMFPVKIMYRLLRMVLGVEVLHPDVQVNTFQRVVRLARLTWDPILVRTLSVLRELLKANMRFPILTDYVTFMVRYFEQLE